MTKTKIKIALIDDDPARAALLKHSLIEHSIEVVASISVDQVHAVDLQQLHAEIMLFNMDQPHIETIRTYHRQYDLPSILFTQDSHKDSIHSAIEGGITMYRVEDLQPIGLETILATAIVQYSQHKKLRDELKDTKTKLADRKDIEKAKILLLNLYQLNEEQAFVLLRKNAMSHRITIGEMARRLVNEQRALPQSQFKSE